MNVCVFGLWHLGTVTAACLASGGHQVVGLDFDADVIQGLQNGQPPLFEPDLETLVSQGLEARHLSFTTQVQEAITDQDLIWVTYDTPVDEDDQADVEFVVEQIKKLFPYLQTGMLVLISSQLPVGTTSRLAQAYTSSYADKSVTFAYSPENLRLGKAIEVFTNPDRVVMGTDVATDQARLEQLMRPFTDKIEWMSVASAEMTKHALNAFLATSVAFANEIAVLCELMGADASEVERGLKSETRIGPRAYLKPGAAFAGGTLARDIAFLTHLGKSHHLPTHLLTSVRVSNNAHKLWIRNTLERTLPVLKEKRIAVWGLTYKPNTDTLRRSSAVELCLWLSEQGCQVMAHDPAIEELPDTLAGKFTLTQTPQDALKDASALVVATEWPDYRALKADAVISKMSRAVVIDPYRFLYENLGTNGQVDYMTVGKAAI